MKVELNGRWIAEVILDLTLYLPEAPTADMVRAAWRVYRTHCPPEALSLVKHTRMPLWDHGKSLGRDDALDCYLIDQDRRRDHGVIVRHNGGDAGWTFLMRGIFPKDVHAERSASLCRVILPMDTDPEILLKIAKKLCDVVPGVSGHGGYGTTYSSFFKETAFDQIYAWARRYRGIDVEDLNATLPLMLNTVKGANWLTILSHDFWNRLAEGADPVFPEGTVVGNMHFARILRAGQRPTLGDRNRRSFPDAYAAVERFLSPVKVQGHPEFAGRFRQEGATAAWLRRLVDPENW
jgi:hypothetical protein